MPILRLAKDIIHDIRYQRYLDVWVKEATIPKPSYAQFKEDLLIEELIGPVKSYIDIGANDGITCSNTFLFASKGAQGLAFEPIKVNYSAAVRVLRGKPNVLLVREGISSSYQKTKAVIDGWRGQTSFISKDVLVDRMSRTQRVILRPLKYWVEKLPQFSHVDLLSIDVEGHELEVLHGIDFKNISTKCLIIETDKVSIQECNEVVSAFGYKALLTNDVNTIWLKAETLEAFDIQKSLTIADSYRLV